MSKLVEFSIELEVESKRAISGRHFLFNKSGGKLNRTAIFLGADKSIFLNIDFTDLSGYYNDENDNWLDWI